MAVQFSILDKKSWKVPFFTVWSGQALSIFGSQLVQFALIWYLTVLTGSATVLAAATLASTLPGVLLGPFIGTLVDRWNRRAVMIAADSLITLTSLLLSLLFFSGAVSLWQIYALIFLRSLAGSFHGFAMNASTSLMVPVEHLVRIQGINQMLTGGLNVIAAPLGAMLLELIHIQGVLGIDVITGIVAVAGAAATAIPQPESSGQDLENSRSQTNIWEDLKIGVVYLVGWPGLLIIGLMTVGINFTIIPAYSLLPLLVKDWFGGGATQLGWFEASMAAGIIGGSLLLTTWGGFRRKIVTTLMGVIGIGVGTLILAVAPRSALSLAIGGAFIAGASNPLTMGPFFATLQSTVEPELQARLFALLSSIGGGIVPLGLMIAGPVGDKFGIQAWFLGGGVFCILMGIVGLMIPAVLGLEEGRPLGGGDIPGT